MSPASGSGRSKPRRCASCATRREASTCAPSSTSNPEPPANTGGFALRTRPGMKQLFIVLLGGKHPRARIEVHDIVAATGERLADTYPQLREQWFGAANGLHIDAWMQVSGIDGYQLHFSNSAPAAGEPRLYLINLGGYTREEFGEAHRYLLVTAATRAEAKQKGK